MYFLLLVYERKKDLREASTNLTTMTNRSNDPRQHYDQNGTSLSRGSLYKIKLVRSDGAHRLRFLKSVVISSEHL